jgi:hypothetical protein
MCTWHRLVHAYDLQLFVGGAFLLLYLIPKLYQLFSTEQAFLIGELESILGDCLLLHPSPYSQPALKQSFDIVKLGSQHSGLNILVKET